MQTEAVNVSRETHKILPHNLASLGMLTLSHLNSSHGCMRYFYLYLLDIHLLKIFSIVKKIFGVQSEDILMCTLS